MTVTHDVANVALGSGYSPESFNANTWSWPLKETKNVGFRYFLPLGATRFA